MCRRIGKVITREPYWDGSWYGNDTIWRTIKDLNLIVRYADEKGNIHDVPQRTVLNICDMIISGEKDGPMQPSPKFEGVLLAGESIYALDKFIAGFFGFDEKYVKSIEAVRDIEKIKDSEIYVIENGKTVNIKQYNFSNSNYIQAAYGWQCMMKK